MYVIAGLGNPGLRYAKTRHNMGFMAVDALAEMTGTRINKTKFEAKTGEGHIAGQKIVLVKPQTFMNLSGRSIWQVSDFYKVEHDKLILIYDDLDIQMGSMRIRAKGSAGTHNGMKSVINSLGFDDFPRIRIGIGSEHKGDTIDYVIGKMSREEKDILKGQAERAARAVISIIEEGIDKTMNRYNGDN